MNFEQWFFNKVQENLIYIDEHTTTLYYRPTINCKFIAKKTNAHNKSGRLRYVFHIDGKYNTVYKNRLVWMFFYKSHIPDGYVVDHIDGNRQNDHITNLQLMTLEESHRQGYHCQTQDAFTEVSNFFLDKISF
jgi:hypothetical protein